ncbi:MAG: PsbP-related protein [Candidatus Margulisiibacteriota bacterium]|jgi:hypothetical protein
MKKRLILSSLTGLAIVLVVVGCAPAKKEGDKKLLVTTAAVTQTSTKEWKTYVSKYGFSVSYPRDWFLKEDTDNICKEGYRPFDIYNYDADHPKNEPGVSISFGFNDETTKGIDKSTIPSDPYERILFLARKHNLYMGENEKNRTKLNMAYPGILVKYETKPIRIMFYIQESDALLGVDLDSEHGTEEYFKIIDTIKKNE